MVRTAKERHTKVARKRRNWLRNAIFGEIHTSKETKRVLCEVFGASTVDFATLKPHDFQCPRVELVKQTASTSMRT